MYLHFVAEYFVYNIIASAFASFFLAVCSPPPATGSRVCWLLCALPIDFLMGLVVLIIFYMTGSNTAVREPPASFPIETSS